VPGLGSKTHLVKGFDRVFELQRGLRLYKHNFKLNNSFYDKVKKKNIKKGYEFQ